MCIRGTKKKQIGILSLRIKYRVLGLQQKLFM